MACGLADRIGHVDSRSEKTVFAAYKAWVSMALEQDERLRSNTPCVLPSVVGGDAVVSEDNRSSFRASSMEPAVAGVDA